MNYQPRPFDSMIARMVVDGPPPPAPADHLHTYLVRTEALGLEGFVKAALYEKELHMCIYPGKLLVPLDIPYELIIDIMVEFVTEEEIKAKWEEVQPHERRQIIGFVNGNRHLPELRFFLCECDAVFSSGNVETSRRFITVGGHFNRPGLANYQLAALLGFELEERPEKPPKPPPPAINIAPSGATIQRKLNCTIGPAPNYPLPESAGTLDPPQKAIAQKLAKRSKEAPKHIRVGGTILRTRG